MSSGILVMRSTKCDCACSRQAANTSVAPARPFSLILQASQRQWHRDLIFDLDWFQDNAKRLLEEFPGAKVSAEKGDNACMACLLRKLGRQFDNRIMLVMQLYNFM